ncbi:hypothetical protein VP01_2067g1, partial [Puccinia sorghi]
FYVLVLLHTIEHRRNGTCCSPFSPRRLGLKRLQKSRFKCSVSWLLASCLLESSPRTLHLLLLFSNTQEPFEKPTNKCVYNSNKQKHRKTDGQVVQRALEAVGMIQNAQEMIPGMLAKTQSDPSRPWASFWMPVLLAYGQQCINGNREVRQQALGHLQRSLMAPEILSNGKVDLTIIFERVLFPVLEDLLKPQVFRRDPEGMGETRLRASGLLCKIFLHYLVQLSLQGMPRMTELWLQILGLLDRFMHSGRRDQMVSVQNFSNSCLINNNAHYIYICMYYEAVPENLKNVLLVMHASGFLIPPHENPSAEESHLWTATFERIDPVLNTLKTDLFPPPATSSNVPSASPRASDAAAPDPPLPSPSQNLHPPNSELPVAQSPPDGNLS